jgi:hypothetical protein
MPYGCPIRKLSVVYCTGNADTQNLLNSWVKKEVKHFGWYDPLKRISVTGVCTISLSWKLFWEKKISWSIISDIWTFPFHDDKLLWWAERWIERPQKLQWEPTQTGGGETTELWNSSTRDSTMCESLWASQSIQNWRCAMQIEELKRKRRNLL